MNRRMGIAVTCLVSLVGCLVSLAVFAQPLPPALEASSIVRDDRGELVGFRLKNGSLVKLSPGLLGGSPVGLTPVLPGGGNVAAECCQKAGAVIAARKRQLEECEAKVKELEAELKNLREQHP